MEDLKSVLYLHSAFLASLRKEKRNKAKVITDHKKDSESENVPPPTIKTNRQKFSISRRCQLFVEKSTHQTGSLIAHS